MHAALVLMLFTVTQNGEEVSPNPNLKFPTFGGTQVWTDQRVQAGWRIQKNVLTGHYRFLNSSNIRMAWGTSEQCDDAFAQALKEGKIPPLKREVVLLLHGLVRTRGSMESLAEQIGKDRPDTSVMTFSYASGRNTVAEHAAAVRGAIAKMEGVEKIHFIGHSLGNLVVRRYLYDLQIRPPEARRAWPETGRIVMLAPPNQGSRVAEVFRNDPIFRTVWGVSGSQIAQWHDLAKTLAIPRTEFAIIAGGKESRRNPLLTGQNDWVVTVDETRLPGAHDFMVLPVLHSTMMNTPEVQEATIRFLRDGSLRENGERQPIQVVR
jgi:pimeloyl-ACP methyl ester carboxylesterase